MTAAAPGLCDALLSQQPGALTFADQPARGWPAASR